MLITWNLSRRRWRYSRPDVLVLSVGKSGRTWLRVLLNKYLSLRFNTDFSLDDLHAIDQRIPSIGYEHEHWSHHALSNWHERLRGKFLVPADILRKKRVIVLYRDPRDVAVSLYFQNQKRSNNRIDCTLEEFVRLQGRGVRGIVTVMNAWRKRLEGHPNCLWVSYEALRRDTASELRRIVDFLGTATTSPEQVEEAVAFASFDNMQRLEASGGFSRGMLKPGVPGDPSSFKVRSGKVGGYRERFSAEDLRFLDESVAALDPFFGYAANPAAATERS